MPSREAVPAVIAGVGHTAFSTKSGRLESELAIEAIVAALTDAGLSLRDVDGLVTYDVDNNDPMSISRELALGELGWFSKTPFGGGQACGTIQDAVLAIESGAASVVVAYRAANMRSGPRYGTGGGVSPQAMQYVEWSAPSGLMTPGQMGALWMHRYLHDRGLTNADLGHIVVSSRRYAQNNPLSRFFGKSFCMEDYLSAPWAVEPVLRVPDCCLENDGGVAIVVTRPDIVGTGKNGVAIRGAARGMARAPNILQNFYRKDTGSFPDLQVVLCQLWEQTGITASNLDLAIVYDAFSPFIYVTLEELGLVDMNEVAQFVASGGIDVGGELPINTNGGQLGEAYLHGFNGMIEAVKQTRGTAVNQVADIEHVLVTGGPALPTSGLILSPY